jgi:nucleotide-binding universal stress UspA family protein
MFHEETPGAHSDAERPIVVGVDGSPCATRALEYAAHQAAHEGAVLVIVSVYALPATENEMFVSIGLLKDAAEAVVHEAVEHVAEIAPDVVTKGEHVLGAPGPILVAASEEASALVVGTRGHGQTVGLLIGSVSEYVLHHASCTTIVVR